MNELEVYVWIGVGIFIFLMIGLGLYSSRGTKSISDFTIGGGKLGPVLLGLSFAATYLSAAVFLGYPGWSYQWGYANLWLVLGILGGGPIGVVLVAKHVRKINSEQKSLSLSDWLGDFYNSNLLRIGTGLILLFNIFYIAGQFVAGARVFEYTLGISYKVALIFIVAIVILYVFIGGTLADVYTDAVQVIVMAIAGIIIFISGIVLFWEGSVTSTFQEITVQLASQNKNYVTVFNSQSTYFDSLSAAIGAFLIQVAFAISAPQLFNKVLGLKNEKDIGKMIIVYVITMVFCVIVIFGGLYSRAYFGNGISISDMALMEYIAQVFPASMAAFIVIVILAAALSTTDGLFVSISTVFANDIFLKVIVKQGFIKINVDRAEKIALHISRLSVLLIGILAYWIVLSPPKSMGDIMWIGISGIAAGTVGPVLYAVFSKDKASPRAAELSMILGLASYFILYFGGIEKSTMAAGAWATLIGIGVMLFFAKVIKTSTPETRMEEHQVHVK